MWVRFQPLKFQVEQNVRACVVAIEYGSNGYNFGYWEINGVRQAARTDHGIQRDNKDWYGAGQQRMIRTGIYSNKEESELGLGGGRSAVGGRVRPFIDQELTWRAIGQFCLLVGKRGETRRSLVFPQARYPWMSMPPLASLPIMCPVRRTAMGTGGLVRTLQFGDLNQTGSDDPDGDGYTITEELALGQESTIEDSVEWECPAGCPTGLFMPILPWCLPLSNGVEQLRR